MDLMGSLCEELVAEILDRIPLPIKPVIRMKCLSKHWHDLITRYRKSRSLTSTSTLICQYRSGLDSTNQVIFLNAVEDHDKQQVQMHKALGFSIDNHIQLMGSSNGLLLFSQYVAPLKLVVYVCNPAQKQWKWDALPPFDHIDNLKQTIYANIGISYDGVPDHPYKVVCYCRLNLERLNMEFQIYSSDTQQWKKHAVAMTGPPEGITRDWRSLEDCNIQTPHLFRNGKMLCVVDDYMLECHFEKNSFKLVKLPCIDQRCVRGILFLSEGCLHYCGGLQERISIWKYVSIESTCNNHWKQMQGIEITKIVAPNTEYNCMEPCGFDEELQILYIQFQKTIFCYSLQTRKLEEKWIIQDLPERFVEYQYYYHQYCILQSSTRSRYPIGDDCILSLPEAGPQGPELMTNAEVKLQKNTAATMSIPFSQDIEISMEIMEIGDICEG